MTGKNTGDLRAGQSVLRVRPEKGDRGFIRSFVGNDDTCVCHWKKRIIWSSPACPERRDLRRLARLPSEWTAAWHLMRKSGASSPPCTVTAEFDVKLKRPSSSAPVTLRARVVEAQGDRAVVEATLEAGGKVTATSPRDVRRRSRKGIQLFTAGRRALHLRSYLPEVKGDHQATGSAVSGPGVTPSGRRRYVLLAAARSWVT